MSQQTTLYSQLTPSSADEALEILSGATGVDWTHTDSGLTEHSQDRAILRSWVQHYGKAQESTCSIQERWSVHHKDSYFTAESTEWSGQQVIGMATLYAGPSLEDAVSAVVREARQ